ncbi:MAG: hypothetical protein JW947_10095 [Sedimentisphaerales bacterium]|nr:hypothetical protein [Sedimentisphaerales bacterium]
MASEAKNLANRLNAQKSTGPRTPQGKAVASQNSLKHGLLAERDVIALESQADFDLYRKQILDELKPVSPMESVLADRIVTLSWRLKRAGRFQNQAIDTLNADESNNPLKKLTQSVLFKSALRSFANSAELDPPQPAPTTADDRLPLGRLAVNDFSDGRVLDRLLMYERRIENSFYKALLEFQRLNILRKMERNRKLLEGFNDEGS